MSQYSGYSTASKQALALKDKEMAAKDEAAKLSLAIKDKALEEKNEKMLRMQIQLDEMAKRMNSISTPQTRGRGRPRGGGVEVDWFPVEAEVADRLQKWIWEQK